MKVFRRSKRHRRICDVHLVLLRGDEVLMSLRRGGWASGQWQVPAGHLEPGEHTAAGTAREAGEELGIRVDPERLELVHVMDHNDDPPYDDPRIGVFYRAAAWEGEPYNAEPDKCGGLRWVDLSDLPDDSVPYQAAALAHIAAGRVHSVFGWTPDTRTS